MASEKAVMSAIKGATPRPWTHHAGTIYALNGDGTNRFSANMQPGNRYQPPLGASWEEHHAAHTLAAELAANAELIVRAVNSHESLVKALRAMTELYVDLAGSGDCGNWNPEEEAQVIQARAALLLATGEK